MKWLCFALIVLLDFLACTMMCVSTAHLFYGVRHDTPVRHLAIYCDCNHCGVRIQGKYVSPKNTETY